MAHFVFLADNCAKDDLTIIGDEHGDVITIDPCMALARKTMQTCMLFDIVRTLLNFFIVAGNLFAAAFVLVVLVVVLVIFVLAVVLVIFVLVVGPFTLQKARVQESSKGWLFK